MSPCGRVAFAFDAPASPAACDATVAPKGSVFAAAELEPAAESESKVERDGGTTVRSFIKGTAASTAVAFSGAAFETAAPSAEGLRLRLSSLCDFEAASVFAPDCVSFAGVEALSAAMFSVC
jgi:hypothetical protein